MGIEGVQNLYEVGPVYGKHPSKTLRFVEDNEVAGSPGNENENNNNEGEGAQHDSFSCC